MIPKANLFFFFSIISLDTEYIKLKFAIPNISCKLYVKLGILEENPEDEDDDDFFKKKLKELLIF